ncbi:MAG: metal ABC transporter ATP-binding protein, partial [Patescibacteria group bacterium]
FYCYNLFMSEVILKVANLSVEFDGHRVLDGVSFSVKPGEVLAVVGPNGAGKSVMFRALLGLIPYSGDVDWQPGVNIGYVPQKLAIERALPLTVKEFLHFKSGDTDEKEILQALESVGIKTAVSNQSHLEHHILNRRLSMLSGGEFQRVLIAWSLLGNPDILLFDEPTAGVDIGGEETIYNLLRQLHDQRDLTIILISHDLNIVYKYANQVICLNQKIVCSGIPSQVLNSESLAALYGEEATVYHHPHAMHHE